MKLSLLLKDIESLLKEKLFADGDTVLD